MKPDEPNPYPLVHEFLTLKGLPMKAAFTVGDVAAMFDVTSRAIQSWVSIGKLRKRDVPGWAKIFPADLEQMLKRYDDPEPPAEDNRPVTGPRPVPSRPESIRPSGPYAKRSA